MSARLKVWRRRLIAGGGGMFALSFVLIVLVMVRFEYASVEGHVLELLMWAFGAGYAMYAGVALSLFGRALARVGGAVMIAVIDYKAGNLTSVVKALDYLGSQTVVTQDPEVVRKASKIVLPGVGHFRATALLEETGITEAVREAIGRGSLFLGVCVGLQWLFEGSTEAGEIPGLGYFEGLCERFPMTYDGAELKSPHVGWNSLERVRSESRLLRGVAPGGFVYYTHSWRAPVLQATASVTYYGGAFTGVVEEANVMGVQFHPEKSSRVGLQVLKNFVEM